jgi:hypothetical protein
MLKGCLKLLSSIDGLLNYAAFRLTTEKIPYHKIESLIILAQRKELGNLTLFCWV